MKFLFDATVLQQSATGIAKATMGLYEACLLEESEIEVTAFHRRPLACSLPANIHSVQYGTYFPEFIWRKVILPKYISDHKPMIVHFPWNGNIPKKFINTIIITTLHDVLPLNIPNYFKTDIAKERYRKRVQTDIDRTDLLITDSEYSKKEIMNNFKITNEPLVLHHGPTIRKKRERILELNNRSGDYFLYVGGYDPRKGIEKLIKIFINLHGEKKITSKLILTGSQEYFSQEFKFLIDKGYSLKIIEEKGYVSDNVLADLYSGAKALVYPSKYEGFGLPPLEAMALGCPVITTRYTSIPEICGDAALYINPDNDNSFAEGLISLENDSNLRHELKVKGMKQAAKFSWDTSAKKFLNEIQKFKEK